MTFEALRRLAISNVSVKEPYYDDCRRKRGRLEYDSSGDVSNAEAEDLANEATRFARAVREWLGSAHPELIAVIGALPSDVPGGQSGNPVGAPYRGSVGQMAGR